MVPIVCPATNSTTGEPHGERGNLVIATNVSVCRFLPDRGSTEFSTPNDKGLVEKSTLLQIRYQRGAGLIRLPALACQSVAKIGMMVPIAVAQVDETDATLDHSSREQAISGEGRLCRIDPVKRKSRLRLSPHVECFARGFTPVARPTDTNRSVPTSWDLLSVAGAVNSVDERRR